MQKARLIQFILNILCRTSARRIKPNLHILTFSSVYSIKFKQQGNNKCNNILENLENIFK